MRPTAGNSTVPTALRPESPPPRPRRFILALLLAATLSAQAIVYTLRSGTSGTAVADRLNAKVALRERVTVSGHAGQLTVALSDFALPQALRAMESLLEGRRHASATGTVLVEAPSVEGRAQRHLLLSLGAAQRTLLISIDLPDAALRPGHADSWPTDLPRPNAERIGLVITLPGRDAAFASFSVNRPAAAAFREYGRRLEDAGWRPVSRQPGTCTVFADKHVKRLAVFGVMTDRRGITRGAVYVGGNLPGL